MSQFPVQSGRSLASGDVVGCSYDLSTGVCKYYVFRRVKLLEAFEDCSTVNKLVTFEKFVTAAKEMDPKTNPYLQAMGMLGGYGGGYGRDRGDREGTTRKPEIELDAAENFAMVIPPHSSLLPSVEMKCQLNRKVGGVRPAVSLHPNCRVKINLTGPFVMQDVLQREEDYVDFAAVKSEAMASAGAETKHSDPEGLEMDINVSESPAAHRAGISLTDAASNLLSGMRRLKDRATEKKKAGGMGGSGKKGADKQVYLTLSSGERLYPAALASRLTEAEGLSKDRYE